MHLSINTAVFEDEIKKGKSQLECLERLPDKIIDSIEVRGEFFDEERVEEELEEISNLCEKNRWKLFYSVPQELFNSDGFNQDIENKIALAEKYNVSNLKYSLGHINVKNTDINELNDILNNTSVNVTIENQPNDNGSLVEMKKALNYLNDNHIKLGYTFDSGNWYWINENPHVAFDELRENISVFHLKDIKSKNTMMLNNGDTDWRYMLNKLGENIPVFLEYGIDENKIIDEMKKVEDVLMKR
ncbi:sugar phosphate isomerase/epimerase family protein [Ligilactobacillus salivarius]|uniref:sugar phosphate isomerase/epimerase family protein n=2 Tax=Ligilactobacillus salivarius TaxID=1624 RepID=UPI0009DA4B0F|nr:TIM barrel protein [Ligilactobacillus salivarius]MYU38755.1 sugar phosphate isomerase/epimerase [Ligilactobacillus salivarius]MYU73867.1 sugar phosphate isomerase/epimerase [Ligilactobacillus salivarius]MYU90282.1 sugar phosphate isomerase/epimerase [Ligilactobacillus salivarius]MYU95531.1 sugar phosphate isomerase/epimerase [Ligilactobacillus salivarius]MYU97235.1 sugar phosphate isomerase/epimerase [Ligilactobacillus salivarius]